MTPHVECQEWRDKVMQYHRAKIDGKEKSKNLQSGTRILLPESWSVREFTLSHIVGRSWRAIGNDGRNYKLPLKAIQQAKVLS
jgi:hypothetical protein